MHLPNKAWWDLLLLKSGDPEPVVVVMTPPPQCPLWRYVVRHQGSPVEGCVDGVRGVRGWGECGCEGSVGVRGWGEWGGEGSKGVREGIWKCIMIIVYTAVSIGNLLVLVLMVLSWPACCHGYLNNPLGVLQDNVNVLWSKILGSVWVCECVCSEYVNSMYER